MIKRILFALIPAVLSSFVAPLSAFEEMGEVSLEPMEKPSPLSMVAGTERHWLKIDFLSPDDRKEHITYYESVGAEKYSVRDSDGCSQTSMIGMFAPVLKWYDCRQGRSGTQEIIETMGNPWPLSENTEFQYVFAGKWDDGFGAQWYSTRKCKVDKQVRVNVPAGEFDTYKLICEDPWLKWTYWISPDLGYRVAFKKKDKTFLSRSYMLELVQVISP
jgi:hypothetical protein